MDIQKEIRKGKLVLDFYHYMIPDYTVYLLGGLYGFRFQENDSFYGRCSLESLFYNLSFFNNHFFSENVDDFIREVESIFFLKNYPFAVLFRKEEAECSVLFPLKKSERQLILYDKENKLRKSSLGELKILLGDGNIDWYVIIPPRKNVDKKEAFIREIFYSSSYIIQNLQNHKLSVETVKHVRTYIKCLIYINKLFGNNILERAINQYQEVLEQYQSGKDVEYVIAQEIRVLYCIKKIILGDGK